MAKKLSNQETYQISTYLKTPSYERFQAWKADSGHKSESEALLRCPRSILFPQEYPADSSDVALAAIVKEAVDTQVAELMGNFQPVATSSNQRQWVSTREAYDKLQADGDTELSFDRFRRLKPEQLHDRFNLVADQSRRIHGSNTSKWLYFAD